MYSRILCPVDGSEASNRGVEEAVKLAKSQHAKLLFFHVMDSYLPVVDGVGNFVPVDILDVLRQNAEEVIGKATALAQEAGITAETEVIETVGVRPSIQIVKASESWGADLIVMGTNGLRGLSRFVMGSDAEHVVRASEVPVMLVKKPE